MTKISPEEARAMRDNVRYKNQKNTKGWKEIKVEI